MKDSAKKLLDKAERAIIAANTLLSKGDTEFATGRAYYAMFYIAEALLDEKGLHFRKHGGVHGAFGEHFVKNGHFRCQISPLVAWSVQSPDCWGLWY